jgi:hypothetical protein
VVVVLPGVVMELNTFAFTVFNFNWEIYNSVNYNAIHFSYFRIPKLQYIAMWLSMPIDGVWIGNKMYSILIQLGIAFHRSHSVTQTHTLVFSVCYSIHYPLLGSGFEHWTFLLLWVLELSLAPATNFSQQQLTDSLNATQQAPPPLQWLTEL